MMRPKMKPNDLHVVMDGKTNLAKIFNSKGELIDHQFSPNLPKGVYPVFPHGINGPRYDVTGGDTPPGLYKFGLPQFTRTDESVSNVKRPYGRCFIPMIDFEGVEAAVGRLGIGHHGGGKIADYWDDYQELTYTLGCPRGHNKDVEWMAHKILELDKVGGVVWCSVFQ